MSAVKKPFKSRLFVLAVGGILSATALGVSTRDRVAKDEGLRLEAYIPVKGDVPTICFGETRGVKLGMKKTRAECEAMLDPRLLEFEKAFATLIEEPDLVPDSVHKVMVSTIYNIGPANFAKSSMRRKINARDYRGACDALLLYKYQNGRVLQGLVNRRTRDRAECLTGVR